MRLSASALWRAWILASIPIAGFAQTPVIVEAESGALGANIVPGTLDDVTYVTTNLNGVDNPPVNRRVTHAVTFPAGGNYDLYARIRIGPGGGDDDSWYFANGFGNTTNWVLYNTGGGGFTGPGDTVVVGGGAGTQVWKWVRLTNHPGRSGGYGINAWVVPADNLTQTFTWGTREDGLFMDKIAFGPAGTCYTVAELDAGTGGTAACPPPPPPPPPPYTRVGDPIATGLPKFLGSAWSPGNASTNFTAYYNKVTPENAGKWASVEGTRDVMNWGQLDTSYQLAKTNGWPFHFHVLFWGNQQPNWLQDLPAEEQLEEIHEWLAAIAARYPEIDILEVVNEPLHDPPNAPLPANWQPGDPIPNCGGCGNYLKALGATGPVGDKYEWDWIVKAFRLARQYFPHAKLMLNDYSITNDGNSTTRYLGIINRLREERLIDIVGIQGHAFSQSEAAPMPNFRANLDRLAAGSKLPIHVTELDVDGTEDEVQLAGMKKVFPIFWEHPAVTGITLWGYKQNSHWRNAQGAWLIWSGASEGAERPAMQWIIRYVQNKLPVVPGGQGFYIEETAPNGTAIGTVEATDADAGTVFSDWRVESGIDNSTGNGIIGIDAATGTLLVLDSAALAANVGVNLKVYVTVFDGYRRSDPRRVGIVVLEDEVHLKAD
jgi:endo-1,4-beta-xylanase